MRKMEFVRVTKVAQSDSHSFMACGGRLFVCPEQAIPPWEIETEIAVGLISNDRVMDPMHFRGDNQETEYFVQSMGKPDISMVKHGCSVEKNFKKDD